MVNKLKEISINIFAYLCTYIQVAYHGIPDKAYEVFLDAHKHNSLTRRSNALDSKNPAGNKIASIIC